MKTIYFLIAILLFSQHLLYAAPDTPVVAPAPVANPAPVDAVNIKLDSLIKYTEILKASNTAIKSTVDSIAKTKTANCVYTLKDHLNCGEWLLVFTPVFVFILFIGLLFFKGLADFDLTEALKENELTKVTVPNPHYTGAPTSAGQTDVPLTMEVTANVSFTPIIGSPPSGPLRAEYTINDDSARSYRPSISRYIAFISSLLIIVIAVCLSSFFIYHYIKTGCPPELGALTTVLVALGIGIVPYAANKVSAAVAGKPSGA